jgi:hypothetical protein
MIVGTISDLNITGDRWSRCFDSVKFVERGAYEAGANHLKSDRQ